MYGRVMGWHARRIRRVAVLGVVAAVAFLVAWPLLGWELGVLAGWDVAAALFLVVSWEIILHATGDKTRELATLEDPTRPTAALIILISTVASLLAVAFTLAAADDQRGWERGAYVVAALATIVLSWTVLNTLYTLRYADHHYRIDGGAGVEFGADSTPAEPPDYRDFAYLAFTVGMCYQVSDQTIRTRDLRRTVLVHSIVSYAFGVVIIASTINVLAGFINT
jgi:uncharacterized membrane protein